MQKELKRLSGERKLGSYSVVRYWHPDARKSPELIRSGLTLEQAQEHCKDPETSNKTGPTHTWYFDGFTESSKWQITLW